MSLASINGIISKAEDAKISILDRGFKFGDGVFETVRIIKNIPYLWNYHIDRLIAGANSIKIKLNQEIIDNIILYAQQIVLHSKMQEGVLRISVSRGIGSKGYMPIYNIKPNIAMELMPKNYNEEMAEPQILFLSNYIKISPMAIPVHYKLMQGMNSILAKIEAREQNCFDALMLNNEGNICEASSGNIFWYDGCELHTPAIECGVLEGVTRRRIMELSPYKINEGVYTLNDLQGAKSVFITNVNWQALPVNKLLPNMMHFANIDIVRKIHNILWQDQISYVQKSFKWNIG